MSLLYIGAGVDTSILKCNLPEKVNMFIFVDSRPKTEWGTVEGYYNPVFLKQLKGEMQKLGFYKVKRFSLKEKGEEKNKKEKKYERKGVIIFKSKKDNRTVYYFYSTVFSKLVKNTQLTDFIKGCNYLFVSGHEPEDDVIEKMTKPIVFIGSDSTVYKREKQSVFAPHEQIEAEFLFQCMAKHKDDVRKWYEFENSSLTLKEVDYAWFFGDENEVDFILY